MSTTQRMAYRQLAGALVSIGLMVAAWVALAPISIDAPQADGRCGPPVVRLAAQERVDDPNAQRIIDRCEDAATDRMVVAGGAVAAGLIGFVAARGVGRRRVHLARERRRMDRARAEVRAAEVRAADERTGDTADEAEGGRARQNAALPTRT